LFEEVRGSMSAVGEMRTGGETAGGFRLNCIARRVSEVEGLETIVAAGMGEGFLEVEAGGTG